MMVHRTIGALVLVLALGGAAGCAAFRSGRFESLSSLTPAPEAQRKTVAVLFTGKALLNGEPQDAAPAFVNAWKQNVLDSYRSSGLFAEVYDGLHDADLRAEVVLTDRGSMRPELAFLTGFTFYLMPSRELDTLVLQTRFRDRTGQRLGNNYQKSETVTLWQHALLIPLLPFRFPDAVLRGALRDLNHATLQAARSDRVF
jgi:hypothetical protein